MALAVYLAGLMIAGSISYYFLADHSTLVILGGMFVALYDLLGLWLQQRTEKARSATTEQLVSST